LIFENELPKNVQGFYVSAPSFSIMNGKDITKNYPVYVVFWLHIQSSTIEMLTKYIDTVENETTLGEDKGSDPLIHVISIPHLNRFCKCITFNPILMIKRVSLS